ncbi:unnamed protein product, partial [Mesorhabditis belari]|uniref:Integrase catalytic domain-containing protein n=1 Tax=Mesorhabditis belari TaxID=2138241 RepID=A0AAF3FLR0_9BILA
MIFGIFGPPKILHSDNGREFVNKWIDELVNVWGHCKVVRGQPRHSQSQGSVERANADIENILCTYQRDRNTSKWAEFLPMIQLIKNRRYHHGIKRSPFAAMFGKNYDDANEVLLLRIQTALSNGSITQEFDFANHDRTIAFEREGARAGQEKQDFIL